MRRIAKLADAWEFTACWYHATRGVLHADDPWMGLCDFVSRLKEDGAITARVAGQMHDALMVYTEIHVCTPWPYYWEKRWVAPRVRYCLQQAELARKELQ